MRFLIFIAVILSVTSLAAEPIPCVSPSPVGLIGSAEAQLKAIERAIQCEDLKIGESMVVDSLRKKELSPTRIPSAYSLERVSEKKFKARIFLNFKPEKDVKASPALMLEKTQNCIKSIQPFFKGNNGLGLEVDILGSEDVSKLSDGLKPPEVPVKIVKAGVRAENIGYPEDIDCKTIGHEVLHLMGLVDEYSTNGDDGSSYPGNFYDENGKVVKNYDYKTGTINGVLAVPKPKWIYAYNCRVVAGRTSMMKIAGEAFSEIVPTIQNCQCETEDCKRMIHSISPKIRSLYLSNSVLIIPDSDFRMNYCKTTALPTLDTKKFEDQGEILKVNHVSATSVDYEYSIFSDPIYNQVKRTRVQCSCDGANKDCENSLQKMKKILESKTVLQHLFCPKGSKQISKTFGVIDIDNPYAVTISPEEVFSYNTITQGLYSGDSLLQPNHFDRIVGGLCAEKAKGYNICSQFFLTTDTLGKCDQVPKECKDSNYFLGTKKE